jgi:ribosomal protein S18 acetylase RimI-like enzyme
MPDKRLIYKGQKFVDPGIDPVCYDRSLFQLELDRESDLFFDIRTKNGIEPARIGDSSSEALLSIGEFFFANRESFFFLFHQEGDLIGSILHLDNYIQMLCVSREYQRQGYGAKLAQYCINRILEEGYTSVELNILDGNVSAERLYSRLGFEEIDMQ